MSGGIACRCPEKDEPLHAGSGKNRHPRVWRVVDYHCNHSHFGGGGYQSSDYSAVVCLRCGAHWRTKARYVEALHAIHPDEQSWYVGRPSYESVMEKLGRPPDHGRV